MRPGLLSKKSVLYDEIFFASRDELNDPIDMQSRYEFPCNSDKTWGMLFDQIIEDKSLVESVAKYFAEICPISIDDLLKNFETHKNNVFNKTFYGKSLILPQFKSFERSMENFQSLLSLYAPSAGYSVSLSETNDEMLMWSHYAQSHTGFCLVFRPIDKCIRQCPKRARTSISPVSGHECSVASQFYVEKVNYDNVLSTIDAFNLLPAKYTGYKIEGESERENYFESAKKQLLTKNSCWNYEREVRLFLTQPSKWISGATDFTNNQRLFYYDFSQVVGVIFGARMEETEKKSMKEMLKQKLEHRFSSESFSQTQQYVFDFLFQQAEICASSRAVKIVDEELVSMGEAIPPGSEYYERRIDGWKKSRGFIKTGSEMDHRNIP
ncbi:DUF2971 domain-containing protein [Halomonas sp. SCS19]|uniref:DUF2971 domain-containing protein n=1 Tax=Halomonas sp. SCS19 TaxID=2950870 RepID=UPI0032DFE035